MADHASEVLIIGSGFGGSVAALRYAQKGYAVAVVESGKRYESRDFPKTNWNLRKSLFVPWLGLRGIMRLDFFRGLTILSGAGVGGGSLVYANTLIQPTKKSFQEGGWPKNIGVADWEKELKPHYEMAGRMLGVVEAPTDFPAENQFRATANELGYGETFSPVNVGVYLGEPNTTVDDPYFDGEGPARSGCNFCGGCMVGCRFNAKNTLDKNYLYLAERLGAVVYPNTEVIDISQNPSGGYFVKTRRSGVGFKTSTWQAERVIVAAGVLGTLKLLLKCRDHSGSLAKLSEKLGFDVRTNSESLLGVRALSGQDDYSRGLAITASVRPNEDTKIELCRYSNGSTMIALLSVPLHVADRLYKRWLLTFRDKIFRPIDYHKFTSPFRWARETAVILIMQSLESRMRLRIRRRFGVGPGILHTEFSETERPPILIEEGVAFANAMAKRVQGYAGSSLMDLCGQSVTAHILGGCPMGSDRESGVIDGKHEVFGYPGLFVVGGASIPANLGANPSYTITAMAERAMSFVPAKQD